MKLVLSLSALAVLTVSAPAVAGFQWVPPQSNPTAKPSERITPVAPNIAPERIINHIRNDEPLPVVAPPPPIVNVPAIGSVPAPVMGSPVMPAPAMSPPPVINGSPASVEIMPPMAPPMAVVSPQATVHHTMPSAFEPVVGFGDNLPLALAITDIVPSSYSHAFASGVNPGVAVSWDGQGRGWDVVLSEILKPHGLMPILRDRHIVIAKGHQSAPETIALRQQPYAMTQPTTMRMQQSAMPAHNMRTPQPPLEPNFARPQAAPEPFSQNYEPIMLTPEQP